MPANGPGSVLELGLDLAPPPDYLCYYITRSTEHSIQNHHSSMRRVFVCMTVSACCLGFDAIVTRTIHTPYRILSHNCHTFDVSNMSLPTNLKGIDRNSTRIYIKYTILFVVYLPSSIFESDCYTLFAIE